MVPDELTTPRPASRPPLGPVRGTPTCRAAPTAAPTASALPLCWADDHTAHQSRFYFVVFMNGSAPLFHSNRIPTDLLNDYTARKDADAATAGVSMPSASPAAPASSSAGPSPACADCESYWQHCAGRLGNPCRGTAPTAASAGPRDPHMVGDFAGNRVGMEEVPQQTLQSIAFPSSFASARAGPSLTRRTPGATRLATPASEMYNAHDAHPAGLNGHFPTARDAAPPRMGHSFSTDSLSGTAREGRGGGAHTAAPSSVPSAPREPPFSLRLEEVRNTKGELRCCRFVATANFATLLSSHTGAMHAMQTRSSAIALVITCPSSGPHYAYLQQHLTLVQALTYRVVHFGMRTMQRFFSLMLTAGGGGAGGGAGAGGRGLQMMRNVTSILERHDEALHTYYELKRHLSVALALCLPLPPLSVPRYPTLRGSAEASQVPRFFQGSFLTQLASFPRAPSGTGATTNDGALPSLSDYLFAALTRLVQFSDGFTSAVAAGVLSIGPPLNGALGVSGGGGASAVPTTTSTAARAGGSASSASAPPAAGGGRAAHTDPYAAFWAQRATQEHRDLGKPPHPTFPSSEPPLHDRRERSWRGLPTVASLATVSATTSGCTSPISPLSIAPTTSCQTAGAAAPPPPDRASPSPPAAASGAPTARDRQGSDGFALGGVRSGRVLIYTRDAELAWCLLLLSATLLEDEARRTFDGRVETGTERASVGRWRRLLNQLAPPVANGPADAWPRSVRESFVTAFAGQTSCSAFVGVPIQWIPQEYSEARLLDDVRQDPFSPYNVVLVIAPRQLLCQRIALAKTLESAMVLLEQTSKGVEVRSAAQPFQCTVLRTEIVAPDDLVDALLRESLQLHRLSGGVLPCAAVLHDMRRWLECQSASAMETNRASQSQSAARSSLPSRYGSRSSLLHPTSTPPLATASQQGRASSPSVPRSLCRREWLPASAATAGPSEDESDVVLEELLLPGSYSAATSCTTAPGGRPSLLNSKGIVVPASRLAGGSATTTAGRSPTSTTGAPWALWSPGTSQLQQLLFTKDTALSTPGGV